MGDHALSHLGRPTPVSVRKLKLGEGWETAAEEEWDGSRWADLEVGYRDAETFLRLFRRLPEAAKYRSDH